MKSILAAAWCLMTCATASCCECKEVTQTSAKKSAAAIFEGTVQTIDLLPRDRDRGSAVLRSGPAAITFAVRKVWKGQLGRQVTVFGSLRNLMCDYYSLTEGTSYLVYAEPSLASKRYNGPKLQLGNLCVFRFQVSSTEDANRDLMDLLR